MKFTRRRPTKSRTHVCPVRWGLTGRRNRPRFCLSKTEALLRKIYRVLQIWKKQHITTRSPLREAPVVAPIAGDPSGALGLQMSEQRNARTLLVSASANRRAPEPAHEFKRAREHIWASEEMPAPVGPRTWPVPPWCPEGPEAPAFHLRHRRQTLPWGPEAPKQV